VYSADDDIMQVSKINQYTALFSPVFCSGMSSLW